MQAVVVGCRLSGLAAWDMGFFPKSTCWHWRLLYLRRNSTKRGSTAFSLHLICYLAPVSARMGTVDAMVAGTSVTALLDGGGAGPATSESCPANELRTVQKLLWEDISERLPPAERDEVCGAFHQQPRAGRVLYSCRSDFAPGCFLVVYVCC